jgi:hypothetical protein
MDWKQVYEISLKQRTFPLLYVNLKAICSDTVPENIFKALHNTFNKNIKRSLFLSAYLKKIIMVFKKHGVFAVPFKGPVLEKDLFDDFGYRFYSDLDLLISLKDVENAYALLLQNGFSPEFSLNKAQLKKLVRSANDLSFYHRKLKIYIELHWELSGNYLSKPLMLDAVYKDLTLIPIYNDPVPTFSHELMLLYLCVHAAKHEWEYLELASCIDVIINHKLLNWDKLEALAEKWCAKRMMKLGIYLAWMLFDSKIPSHILEMMKKEDIIPDLAKDVFDKIFHPGSGDKKKGRFTRSSCFHFRVRDTFSDKTRYLIRLMFRPAKIDWEFFHPASALSFSLYLLRPFRLVLELLGLEDAMRGKA